MDAVVLVIAVMLGVRILTILLLCLPACPALTFLFSGYNKNVKHVKVMMFFFRSGIPNPTISSKLLNGNKTAIIVGVIVAIIMACIVVGIIYCCFCR